MTARHVVAGWFIANIVIAGFSAYVASTKGRSELTWTILSFVFGIVALIAIAGASPIEEEERRREEARRRQESRALEGAKPWVPGSGPPPEQ